jgi:hypothetical protein
MATPKFELIEEGELVTPAEPDSVLMANVLAGLKALPQKTAQTLSNCFALLTVATVFILALMIIPYTPSIYQLSGLTGYALFILAINVIARRK